MRFGFRISRGLWISLPWWCAPLILAVLFAELVYALIMATAMLLAALVGALFHAGQRHHPDR